MCVFTLLSSGMCVYYYYYCMKKVKRTFGDRTFLISFLLHNDTFIKIDTHYSPFKFNRFFLKFFNSLQKTEQIFYGRSNIKMLPHTTRNRTRLNIICTRNLYEEKRKLKIKHA